MMNSNAFLAVLIAGLVLFGMVGINLLEESDDESPVLLDADDVANAIANNYSGGLGKFTVKAGATSESAIITSLPVKYNTDSDGSVSSNSVVITRYVDLESALAALNEVRSKISTQNSSMCIGIETVELAGDSAKAYGIDAGAYKIWARSVTYGAAIDKTYSNATGAFVIGNVLIDFSEVSTRGGAENTRLYYGSPVDTIASDPNSITVDAFKSIVKDFALSTKAVEFKDAKGLANVLTDRYDGRFGKFTVSTSSTADRAIITSMPLKYTAIGSEEVSANTIVITKYASKADALAALGAIESKLSTQSVAMAAGKDTVTIDSSNSGDYGVDAGVYKVWYRNVSDKEVKNDKTYTISTGAVVIDNYLIDFSDSKDTDSLRIYVGTPVDVPEKDSKSMYRSTYDAMLEQFFCCMS